MEIIQNNNQEIATADNGTNSHWEEYGRDYILHLGSMRKAIVVAAYGNSGYSQVDYYSISPRSFFPFSDEDREVRFTDAEECKKYSILKVREWFESVFNQTC